MAGGFGPSSFLGKAQIGDSLIDKYIVNVILFVTERRGEHDG